MQSHDEIMEHTLRLALRGTGKVSPNPRVGCTIVKDGRIIGEGWHREFGGPHAEVDALNRCTEDPVDAIAYVNLEPCAHSGKTPPCAPLLIEKGIRTVVVAMQDPNPLVAGKGIAQLRDAGIEVIENICQEQAFWLNRTFVKHILTGFPYIVGKIAQSLDGCIATASGESQWITCEESRQEVHRMRSEFDAVMIGRGTAEADDPSLTIHSMPGRNPMRIILDTQCSLPISLKVFNDEFRGLTLYCHGEHIEHERLQCLQEMGIQTIACALGTHQHIDIPSLCTKLGREYGIGSILVEGGGILMQELMEQALLDELHLFIAPIMIGQGKRASGDYSAQSLAEAYSLHCKGVLQSGDDIHVIAVKST
ncbi:MAG: bifunctional diaminohydroxyphosphoribosylaminopyrimidine deaminase/5-amino-6-(5-phosphoribosylamino)uracil reductase RibD [Bacteroidota bacterium]|nr:bifunctional diaminohydroxyphosphoribosylaminopyrimidine deaminase/5-amino-6-(5-phosphoribosylamino)uracil reductase RibD [bacterium]NBP63139.1 bifunctional diaminohydroxyphosphoribosylaminopyrimidine deaminase/5-amino-6-(5-phosphoribosylamino)uracil reductase RibD [Bacteroidota bacterium]